MMDGFKPEAVIADKGYDADHLRDAICGMAAEIIIPSPSNRRTPYAYNNALYREGNLVKRFFNKLSVHPETNARTGGLVGCKV